MAATKKGAGRKRKLEDVAEEPPKKAAKEEEAPEGAVEAAEDEEVPSTTELVRTSRLCIPSNRATAGNHAVSLQVDGTVYVIGTGDCGQLGLGEEVTEKMRPGPVHLPDGDKVRIHPVCFTQ